MSLILSGSDGVSDIDGSASTPAIRGTDANTGIFFPAADTIAFGEGGSESMRINSSGYVGIGTTAPGSPLSVLSSVATAQGIYRNTDVSVAGAAGVTLELGALVGTTPTPAAQIVTVLDDANTGNIRFGTRSSGTVTERARITSDGKFLVNETAQLAGYSQQATITCSGSNVLALALKASGVGNIALATTSTDTSTYNAAVFANNGNFSGALKGSISVSNSATTYNTTSDYRLKENIAPMTGALATVAQLKPCTYTWKDGGEIGQGFIAHELQAVVPDCVTGEKDAVDADGKPIYQGVDTSFLVATLTAAIQELSAKNTELETRLAALENK
jgi:hypothetical protein